MNLKKFISGISALTIAASAFAGMAVTASAAATVSTQMNVVDQNFDDTTKINTPYAKWTYSAGAVGTTDKGSMTVTGNVLSLSSNKTNNFTAQLDLPAAVGKINEAATVTFKTGKQGNGYVIGVPYVFYNSNNEAIFSFITVQSTSSKAIYYLAAGAPYTGTGADTSSYTKVAETGMGSYFDVEIKVTPTSATAATVTAKVGTNEAASLNITTTAIADISKITMSPKKPRSDGDQSRAWLVENFKLNGYVDLYNTTVNVTDSTTNTGVTGATVKIDGLTATDNGDGSYSALLPAASYDYVISADGYPEQIGSYTVSADNAENVINISVSSGADITFTTVPGASVTIGTTTLTADAEGKATFNLADGTYDVAVTADGYFNTSKQVVVSDGVADTTAINMTALYTVTYNVDGTETNVVVGQDAKPATAPAVANDLRVGGKAFLGWGTTADATSYVNPTSTVVNTDTTYYAIFSDAITRSARFYPSEDTDTDFVVDAQTMTLRSGTKRGFVSFDSIDPKNAVGGTMNIYATAADLPGSGTRNYNISFATTKVNKWTANTVNSGDGWLENIGGAKETIANVVVPAPSTGFTAGWFSAQLSSVSGIERLYLNNSASADLTFSSIEGSNPEYIELFYTDYAVTVDPAITNGTVEADVEYAKAGETVTLTVNPGDGYELDAISGVDATKVNDTTYTFTMPATAVTVSATFTATSSDPTVGDLVEVPVSDNVNEDGVYAKAYYSDITYNGIAINKIKVTVAGSKEGSQKFTPGNISGNAVVGIVIASKDASKIADLKPVIEVNVD